MERALSQDERIRRAEEIYARRKNARERTTRATVNISSSQPKNFRLFKRLGLQSLICLLIYFIFYLINTTNYSFSNTTLHKTEELISEEVDFIGIYNNIANAVNEYISGLNLNGNKNSEEGIIEQNIINENQINEETETSKSDNENIIEENINEITVNSEQAELKSENIAIINDEEDTSQEEIKDVELSETDRIKQKYSFIIPVKRMDIIRIWRKRTVI